jgi:hypothetical protein
MPATSSAFGDLLDPRFQRIFHEQYNQLPDMVPVMFGMEPHNGRDSMKFGQVGAFGDWVEFTGNVSYDDLTQGFDTTMTYVEFPRRS